MMNNFENIVVTGASGAIGKTFINNLSKYQGVIKFMPFQELNKHILHQKLPLK